MSPRRQASLRSLSNHRKNKKKIFGYRYDDMLAEKRNYIQLLSMVSLFIKDASNMNSIYEMDFIQYISQRLQNSFGFFFERTESEN